LPSGLKRSTIRLDGFALFSWPAPAATSRVIGTVDPVMAADAVHSFAPVFQKVMVRR